jgi:hypothetical protein
MVPAGRSVHGAEHALGHTPAGRRAREASGAEHRDELAASTASGPQS